MRETDGKVCVCIDEDFVTFVTKVFEVCDELCENVSVVGWGVVRRDVHFGWIGCAGGKAAECVEMGQRRDEEKEEGFLVKRRGSGVVAVNERWSSAIGTRKKRVETECGGNVEYGYVDRA